jgi:hypothetical protein
MSKPQKLDKWFEITTVVKERPKDFLDELLEKLEISNKEVKQKPTIPQKIIGGCLKKVIENKEISSKPIISKSPLLAARHWFLEEERKPKKKTNEYPRIPRPRRGLDCDFQSQAIGLCPIELSSGEETESSVSLREPIIKPKKVSKAKPKILYYYNNKEKYKNNKKNWYYGDIEKARESSRNSVKKVYEKKKLITYECKFCNQKISLNSKYHHERSKTHLLNIGNNL